MEDEDVIFRNLQQTKGGTFLVSLPKSWIERHSLEKKRTVIVKELSEGLLIYPKDRKEPKREITLIESERVSRDILQAYLSGYHIIRIRAANEFLKFKDLIKGQSRGLVGLEVLEETASDIELHFLIDSPASLDAAKYLKRCFSLATGMIEESVKAYLKRDVDLAREVKDRDLEVNRLYFLLVRILREHLNEIVPSSDLTPSRASDHRIVAAFAEELGDRAVSVAEAVINNKILELKHMETSIEKMVKNSIEAVRNALNAYLENDLSMGEQIQKEVIDTTIVKQRELEEKFIELMTKFSPELILIPRMLSRLNEIIIDMIDLIIEREKHVEFEAKM
ncbi:MAG: PhoU domain-containing protein [Candidatus Hodarchaeales archaeon]